LTETRGTGANYIYDYRLPLITNGADGPGKRAMRIAKSFVFHVLKIVVTL
jgi:hypothetical protein